MFLAYILRGTRYDINFENAFVLVPVENQSLNFDLPVKPHRLSSISATVVAQETSRVTEPPPGNCASTWYGLDADETERKEYFQIILKS